MLTLPSHILIHPQTLVDALAGDDDSPPDLACLAGMLAEAESCISTMIQERGSLIGANADHLWALHATRNLLALMREAVGDEEFDAWRPHHLACAGDDLLVVVTRAAHAVPPGARVRVARHQGTEMWWFADEQEGCPSFPMRVGAACRRLRGAVRPGDERTWLDLIADALDDTRDLLGSEEMANTLAHAHSLVLKIRVGAAPLSDLLEACSPNPTAGEEGGGMA
jgi:hypothetical protein